jgi:hypothetical protein
LDWPGTVALSLSVPYSQLMSYKAEQEIRIEVTTTLLPKAPGLRLEDVAINTENVSLSVASTGRWCHWKEHQADE